MGASNDPGVTATKDADVFFGALGLGDGDGFDRASPIAINDPGGTTALARLASTRRS